jgi:hypothetical protein
LSVEQDQPPVRAGHRPLAWERLPGRSAEVKSIKLLGLASMITVVVAFAGTSSAMATNTALCAVNEDPCSSENQVKTLHLVNVSSPPMIFWGSLINSLCLSGSLDVEVLEPGSPQLLNSTEFISYWCGWKAQHNECELEVPWDWEEEGRSFPKFSLLKNGENSGILTAESGEIFYSCYEWSMYCLFAFQGMEFSMYGATGSHNGIVVAEKLPLTLAEGSSYMCDDSTLFSVLFESSTDVYITS